MTRLLIPAFTEEGLLYRWPRNSGPYPCSGSACTHREDAGVAWQGLARCACRKAEAVPLYRLLHRARRSCRGAGCPPRCSGSLFLAITGINSKCVANQALEQTRDSVLRCGEPVGRELLNFAVLAIRYTQTA